MSKRKWERTQSQEPEYSMPEARLGLVTPTPEVGNPGLGAPFAGDPFMVSSTTWARTAEAVAARVEQLVAVVREGRIFDAVNEFYAADVELGRGALAPMFGLETGAGRRWLRKNFEAEWRSFHVHGIGVNGDTSFIECSLEFASAEGDRFAQKQVAVAQWRDGRIVKECLIPTR